MKVKSEREVAQSGPTLSDPMDCSPPGPPPMGFSRQEYWSGVPLPSPYWSIVVYKVMLISAVPQCDPAILFHILFHCSLSLDIDYSSLCYTAGPHCEPTYLMISLSRLIICRQLCIDVLQLLHTQQVLNNVMIPWSTPQILGNSPKLPPPVFPVKMTLSTWAARTQILASSWISSYNF